MGDLKLLAAQKGKESPELQQQRIAIANRKDDATSLWTENQVKVGMMMKKHQWK